MSDRGKVPSSTATKSPPGPVDVKFSASRVTKYQPCTIDLRPARVVHYPDLNACLVNERPGSSNHKHEDNVDCRAVHFGYAIPVSVVPLSSRPELAELVLDTGAELSPAATSYLLQHHPQLRAEMQTQQPPVTQQTAADDEDIAAIAKQISDHAEAIYQTWKSRNLAPAELHSVSSSAAPSFAPVLSPARNKCEPVTHSPKSPSPKPSITSPKPIIMSPKPIVTPKQSPMKEQIVSPKSPEVTTVDLMNPSQLELLVNSFVEEDKARQARSSSIQSAVRKFDQQAALNNIAPPVVTTKVPKKSTMFNNFPQENNVSGLTTWPLKNHHHQQPFKPQPQPHPQEQNNEYASTPSPQSSRVPSSSKYATLPAKHKQQPASNAVFLEEVAREEERLINALKTGCVVEPPTCSKFRSKLSDDEMSGLSRVDYAKIRYQAAQENPLTRQRLEDAREIENTVQQQQQQHSTVSEARSRFEAPCAVEAWKPTAEWVPGKYPVDGSGALMPDVHAPTSSTVGHSSQQRGSRLGKAAVPHPELTSQQRQHIRERVGPPTSAMLNPVRPFLTRGSVAERVLIFEKCPPAPESLLLEKRPAITTWRTGNEVHSKTQTYATPRDVPARVSPGHTPPLLRSPTSHHAPIPRFHFPRGRPVPAHETETARLAAVAFFKGLPGERATRQHFVDIAKACGMSVYWKLPLFLACGGGDPGSGGSVTLQSFLDMWSKMCAGSHDEASRFVWLLTRGQRPWLAPEDLAPLVQDVVDTHPGLSFLKEATEFHFRYVHTVISRMFYCANRSWSGRLSIPEIRRSQILAAIRQLEATADINQVTQFFSYEHFYVIYCKFWELDRDHDLFIDRTDLARHNDHALSSRIIDRIFSGAVTRGRNSNNNQQRLGKKPQPGVDQDSQLMSYTEFVWFLLSEEDKTHPTAIEYWFRCMDLDGDGYLSMYELEYFYEEQLQRMEAIGVDTLPFEDCLCQMLDMLRPEVTGKVSLRDLKRCKLSPLFFDTFFNLEKFLEHEQRDPFATQPREPAPDGTEMSDWDRYAAEEYEMLVAEENGGVGDPPDDMLLYDDLTDEDELDEDHDVLSPNLDKLEELQAARRSQRDTEDTWGSADNDEDSGDYAGDSDDYSF